MPVINPLKPVTITPRRPTEQFGEEAFTALTELDAVVSLAAPSAGLQGRYTQSGTLFVRRGSDVKASDLFTYNGGDFRVIGRPRGDQDHPISGDDFGWVAYTIEAAG